MKRRNTPAKQQVLEIFKESRTALSQDIIEHQVKGEINRVTIYRILNSFCEDGVIHKVTSDDGKNYYALCVKCKDHHHKHDHFHFKCTNCGKVECLKDEVKVKLPLGYTFESMNCLVSGICGSCNNN